MLRRLCAALALLQPAGSLRFEGTPSEVTRSSAHLSPCAEALRPAIRSINFRGLFDAARTWEIGGIPFAGSFEYARQWKDAAQKYTVYAGSNLTWGEVTAEEGYSFERKRLAVLGRLEENARHIIQSHTVRSVCDMSIEGIRFISHSANLLQELQEGPGAAMCTKKTLKEMAAEVGDVLEAECFDDCMAELQVLADKMPCDEDTLHEDFYQRAVKENEQCGTLSYDSLEEIADFVMGRKCLDFMPDRLLWTIVDKAPGTVGQVGNEAVCNLPAGKERTRSQDIIEVQGSCPEGSKCKCPLLDMKSRQTAADIRKAGKEHIFSKDGIAAAPNLLGQYMTSFLTGAFIFKVGLGGMAVTAGLLASLKMPVFLVTGSLTLAAKVAYSYYMWECADTLGCWPQSPVGVRINGTGKACRMPTKAKEGGSPVWFMPPPMMRIKHSLGICVLDTCAKIDNVHQRIGLGIGPDDRLYTGKPNVYNCQPLSFEEMTRGQRGLFLAQLRATGTHEEYDLSAAEAMARAAQ